MPEINLAERVAEARISHDPKRLGQLAYDEAAQVRHYVVENTRTLDLTLRLLARDEDPTVADGAQLVIAYRSSR